MNQLTEAQKAVRMALRDDFDYYSRHCLVIRTAAGAIGPLEMNRVQRIVHASIEDQKRRTGRVRKVILKARKPGISTYVAARYYWKVTHQQGARVYVLTHRDEATNNLFSIVKRFHDHAPEVVKPQTSASNAKELLFGLIDSGYAVGTAKAAGVARSDTIQYFHGSEVAFWPNAEEHAAGALEAVPDEPGTEIILESTANGIGGLFYSKCMAAMRRADDYELIFIPWFDHEPYTADPPGEWNPNDVWIEYQAVHKLNPQQLWWAYRKNANLAIANGDDPENITWRFRQEYPADPVEAFQVSGDRSYIDPQCVLAARKAHLPDQDAAPLVLGLDVAGGGGDDTFIIDRQGRVAGRQLYQKVPITDQMELAGWLARKIRELNPIKVFVDVGGGYGSGVVDRCRELRLGQIVQGVQFGSSPRNKRDFLNKRAEMWGDMKEWLHDVGGADIPDDDELHAHLTAPGFKLNSNDQLVLEAKDKIRERLQLSPDAGDALGLTFAERVRTPETIALATRLFGGRGGIRRARGRNYDELRY